MSSSLPSERQLKLITKIKNYVSDINFGLNPELRSIEDLFDLGIINLDKPANPTSHEVTSWVKKILKIKKAGHAGTLDPGVTGSLPIALGRATRSLRALLLAGKEYICIMRLHEQVSESDLKFVLQKFRGKIYQTPPLRSNVKRQLRVREIYYLQIIEHYGDLTLLKIGCQAGTYIRKLCNDVGLALGVGAHMQELRRTKTGPFKEKSCITLQDLKDALYYYQKENNSDYIKKILLPIETAVSHLPKIYIRDSAISAICHGASLTAPGIVAFTTEINKNEVISLFSMKNELIGLATASQNSKDLLTKEHGICAKPIAILMDRKTYPKNWI